MNARSLFDITMGSATKSLRTFQPVLRNSFHRGHREHTVWRPVAKTKRDTRRILAVRLLAAEKYDLANKEVGQRNGPLGDIGIRVLRALHQFMDWRTGRVDPCLDTIGRMVGRCRTTVCAALGRLRDNGFVEWIRRTELREDAGAGPQVRQISNAYGFKLPKAVLAFVQRMLGRAPLPDDDDDRRRHEAQDTRAMLDALPLAELPAALGCSAEMASLLARLGAGVEARSASTETRQNTQES